MPFKIGERVAVNGGSWFGQVIGIPTAGQYEVRVGGTGGDSMRTRLVDESSLTNIHPSNPLRASPREALKSTLDSHKIVLLGCSGHGLNCAETLVNYSERFGQGKENRPIGVVYMEGFIYHPENGIDDSAIKFDSDRKLIANLRKIAAKVIGLETPETAPTHLPLHEQEKFLNEKRCTVANAEWSRLIGATMSHNLPNVACVGAAHLVEVTESNRACPSLAVHLKPLDLRIASLAVGGNKPLYKPADGNGYVAAMPEIGKRAADDDYDSDSSEEGSD
jgi:hypothetical protein